jgi:predicted nucleic acid-binding Zn ribbon protein
MQTRRGKEIECKNCGSEFTTSQRIQNKSYCSIDCYHEYRRKKAGHKTRVQYRFCVICGKTFKAYPRGKKHCSRECFEIAHKDNMRGENNPSYIDGRSYKPTYDAGSEWHHIRVRVYNRDNYECQDCGEKCVGKDTAMKYPEYSKRIIQCHHIVPYDVSQDNSLDNLVTLCIVCHRARHHEMETA